MADKDITPDSEPHTEKVADVQEETTARRGSLRDALYSDEAKRKASIAAMTENTTGELVLPHCRIARTHVLLQHQESVDQRSTRPAHVRC